MFFQGDYAIDAVGDKLFEKLTMTTSLLPPAAPAAGALLGLPAALAAGAAAWRKARMD